MDNMPLAALLPIIAPRRARCDKRAAPAAGVAMASDADDLLIRRGRALIAR